MVFTIYSDSELGQPVRHTLEAGDIAGNVLVNYEADASATVRRVILRYTCMSSVSSGSLFEPSDSSHPLLRRNHFRCLGYGLRAFVCSLSALFRGCVILATLGNAGWRGIFCCGSFP